jgi:hypothetical protein
MLVNNYKTIKRFLFIIIIGCSLANLSYTQKKSHIEKYDCVPNQETAIKIAEAIWFPIYGNIIYETKPFQATLLKNKIWKVEGTCIKGDSGGVPTIFINKKDCKIIDMYHTK